MKYTTQAAACQLVRVAHCDLGDVAVCPDCRVVHVSLQHLSMRIDIGAFHAVAQMLALAQDKLHKLTATLHPAGEAQGAANPDELPTGHLH